MKRIKIIIAIVLLITNKSYAILDSTNIGMDSIYGIGLDSILVPNQDNSFQYNHEIGLIKKESPVLLKRLHNIAKPANWFEDAWDAFTDLFKPVWGHYTEDGFRNEGPYFMFDRTYNGPTYTQIQMQQVKDKIALFPKSSERDIYLKILELAGTTTIDNCNSKNGICASAARAKASAFVYLVGLNGTGGTLSNTVREGYRDRI